jgi:hypothetical protein
MRKNCWQSLHVAELQIFAGMSKWSAIGWWLRYYFRGNGRQFLSRMTWELPQSLLSFFVGLFVVLFWKVQWMRNYEGVLLIVGRFGRKYWGGISFGTMILADENADAEVNNKLFMHEFGHSLQSRASGPIYLFKYGLLSLQSATLRPDLHYLHPVEQDANKRAFDFFSQKEGFATWAEQRFPRCSHENLLPIKWWEYLPGAFPLFHFYRIWKYRRNQ